jgi:tetratricopeptide (TPR) repeat protein
MGSSSGPPEPGSLVVSELRKLLQNPPENDVIKVALDRIADLLSRRLLHAALEECNQLVAQTEDNPEAQAQVFFRLGAIHWHLADYDAAFAHFERAANLTTDSASRCMFLVLTATVLGRLQEYDRAMRVIQEALADNPHQNVTVLALAYANLCCIQGQNGNHLDAIASAQRSLELYEQSSGPIPYFEIYNNMGLAYLEIHHYEEAAEYLRKALPFADGSAALSTLADLGRVNLATGHIEQAVNYGIQAMQLVWSTSLSCEKDEIARLCRFLATLCYRLGQRDVAFHLLEKAELMFGQLGLWREWQETQAQMNEWLSGETPQATLRAGVTLPMVDIERFTRLVDVMIAQELMGNRFSAWIDTRVLYTNVVADALQLSPEDQNKLSYASRFADYGLTALEPEVLANPRLSNAAWEQYRRHPELSAVMLRSLDLDPSIADIIAAHHEHYDGSGYPNQRAGEDIPYLARLLRVVDEYATGVVLQDKPHSQVLREIREASGRSLDPHIVARFEQLFT